LWLGASDLTSRVASALLTLLLARLLGVDPLGQVAFAVAFVALFSITADLGLTALGMRDVARARELTNDYGTHILVLQSVAATLSFLLLAVVIALLPVSTDERTITLIVGLGLIPNALNMAYLFQARESFGTAARIRIITQLGGLALSVCLVLIYRKVVVVPVAALAASLVGSLWTNVALRGRLQFKFTALSRRQLMMILRTGVPFVITAFMIQVFSSIDTVMLEFYGGTHVVGLFNAASRILALSLAIVGFVTMAYAPSLAASFMRDRSRFRRLLLSCVGFLGAIAVPISILGVFDAGPILRLLYGPAFNGAEPVFRLLMLTPILMFLNSPVGYSLGSAGMQRRNAEAVTLAAVANVALNVVLIPRYGMNGAAIATLAAETTSIIYLTQRAMAAQLFGLDLLRSYALRPLAAGAAMGLLLLVLRDHLAIPLVAATGVVVYLAVLLAVGGIPVQDLRSALRSQASG
jgi:O-antigen/teichoic acid export membrane protein